MRENTEKNQQSAQAQQDRQAKKPKFTLPKLPKGLKVFLVLLAVVIFSALVLFVGYHVSYRYWLQQMGDGAYKYSADTYALIEEKISYSMLQEAGPDIRTLQNAINEYNEENGTNLVAKYTMEYENDQTKLIYSVKDGSYFNAEVTVILDKNFTILKNFRNFTSLEGYMISFWNDLEQHVLISMLIIFGTVMGFTFVFFSIIALIYVKSKAKKEKKTSSMAAPQEEEVSVQADENI